MPFWLKGWLEWWGVPDGVAQWCGFGPRCDRTGGPLCGVSYLGYSCVATFKPVQNKPLVPPEMDPSEEELNGISNLEDMRNWAGSARRTGAVPGGGVRSGGTEEALIKPDKPGDASEANSLDLPALCPGRKGTERFGCATLLREATDPERLDGYCDRIKDLRDQFGAGCWGVKYRADTRMRSEFLGRIRRGLPIPRSQNLQKDEQRAEDALAQGWDRLLAQKASLSEDLLATYGRILAALEVEGDRLSSTYTVPSLLLQRTGSLPCGTGADRWAEEKRLHSGLVQVRERRYGAVRRERAGRIIDCVSPLQEAWHSRHWAGSGGGLGRRWPPVTPRLFCMAGATLGDICLRFAWHAWHLATYGTGLALVAALVATGPLCGSYGTGLPRVAALVAAGPLSRRASFAWQAWQSAFVFRGRCGTYGSGLALVAALVAAGPL
eukprot:s1150_g8.t1